MAIFDMKNMPLDEFCKRLNYYPEQDKEVNAAMIKNIFPECKDITVKEKPILFSGPMVRAILEGRKTVTRRIIKGAEEFDNFDKMLCGITLQEFWRFWRGDTGACQYEDFNCPYGKPGEQLWVRETWADTTPFMHDEGGIVYRATDPGWSDHDDTFKWKPSIHMKRSYSRLQLLIDDVRAERLQDITIRECLQEGMSLEHPGDPLGSYLGVFQKTWDELNAKRGYSWDSNPFVWVVSFSVVEGES